MTEHFVANTRELNEDLSVFGNDNFAAPARAPLSGIQSAYYRSKLFNIDTHINPLVSAASPLFALASTLKNSIAEPDLQQLYQDLCHEIKAFENKAQTYNYRSHIILAARYALCSLLDEIILTTPWGSKSLWQTHTLLNTFQRETWGGERFFVILERSCEEPAIHIDLLELLYITLSLGYAGKYQHLERGHLQLSEIMDSLYDIILQQRGEFSQKLFLQQPIITEQKHSLRWLIPIFLTLIFTAALLIAVYCTLNYFLHKHSQSLYQELNHLEYSVNNISQLH